MRLAAPLLDNTGTTTDGNLKTHMRRAVEWRLPLRPCQKVVLLARILHEGRTFQAEQEMTEMSRLGTEQVSQNHKWLTLVET